MAAPILQFKRGAFVNLPGLRAGEPALTSDTFDLYVGIDSTTNNNKFFGSHRYWTKETATTGSGIRFVERTDGGSNYIELKAPNTALASNITYSLPGSQGSANNVLTNDGSGNLSWQSSSSNPIFSGISTFSDTTDNTLGNPDTGAVQIDGGLGVNKNVSIGGSLHVQGQSYFVGIVTFAGGTINLGDGNTDNINVGGEFISGLAPNVDNTYDIGISTQRWKDAYFSGIGSFATGAYIDAIRLGITATNEIDTTSGNLILDSAAGTVEIQDNLTVTGIATITGAFVANGNVTLGDTSGDTITINGTTTFNQPLVGTIGTATRALTVDTTTAPSGTFYPGLFVNNTGTASTAVYVDAGISYVSNTDTLTLTGDIAVNGGDVTTTATTATLFNTNATTLSAFGAATTLGIGANTGTLTVGNPIVVGTQTTQNLYNTVATNLNFGGAATALVMGAATGIATINNATLTLPNATTVNVNGANPTLASSSTGALTLFNTNLTGVNAFGAATAVQIGAATGITTIRNSLRVTNSLYDSTNNQGSSGQFLVSTVTGIGWTTISGVQAGTISTATRALTVDTITAPSGTFYPGLFANNTGTASTAVYVDAGISYVSNTDTLTLTGDIAVNGGDVTTSATTFNLINGTATNVNFAGAATALVMGAATGITTVSNNLTVAGDIRVNGNDIQASDGNANITLTSNTLTTFAGDIRVNGNDIQASNGNVNITMTSNTLTEVKGDLKITGNDIQSSSGTPLSLSGNDVTVNGNLYVSGNTTQVNTTALTVEDRTIDLGIVNGSAPSANTTWDLGILFNYFSSAVAKKSAVIWEHSDSRFKFASVLGADTDGTDSNTPQLTVSTFAPIEIASLWVNGCGTLGAQEIIKCDTTQISLLNITVDAGTF
jgi:hypothetical protein